MVLPELLGSLGPEWYGPRESFLLRLRLAGCDLKARLPVVWRPQLLVSCCSARVHTSGEERGSDACEYRDLGGVCFIINFCILRVYIKQVLAAANSEQLLCANGFKHLKQRRKLPSVLK